MIHYLKNRVKNPLKMNKMNKLFSYTITAVIILQFFAVTATAQRQRGEDTITDQKVIVITQFTPEITDAFRMESLPEIVDTTKVDPEFTYDFSSKKKKTDYNPDLLSAAELKSKPKDNLENGFARLSLGSKLMINGEIYYNNTRDDDFNWGIKGIHKSGHGSLKILDDEKVYAGYNKNRLNMFGKRMYSETTLKGSVDFTSNQNFFYGIGNDQVQAGSFPDDRSEFVDMSEFIRYNLLSVKTLAKSHYNNSRKMNFKVGINYDYWFDNNSNDEHYLDFDLGFTQKIKKEMLGADANLKLIPASFMDSSRMFISFDPYIAHNTENFKVKLGLHSKAKFAGDTSSYHFYPDVHIEHNIADVVLPYFSFTGDLNVHSMRDFSRENPYINSPSKIFPTGETNVKQKIIVGIKGRISEEVQFNVNGKYINKENQHFFINDTTDILQNRFDVVYSDIEMFNAYGELNFDFNKFLMKLYGNYNHFIDVKDIAEPWHFPQIDAGAYLSYRVLPQLTITSDAIVKIGRYALIDNIAKKMNPMIDINLGAEYIISRQLNTFISLNNLAGQNYEIWNQYPVYGFHVMAGINYSF